MLRDFFARIKYLLWYMLTTSPTFPFVFLLGLSALAISVALLAYSFGVFSTNALADYGVTKEVDGFVATVVWAFSLILDTGTFTDNLGVPPGLLAFAAANSVFGLIITSAIIGNVVTVMQKGLEEMKRGGVSVKEVGHLVILGWSRNAIHVLKVFAELGFNKRVVIMTPFDLDTVRGELNRAKKRLRGMKPLLLHGQLTSGADLERIAGKDAANVIFLADESLGSAMSQDAATIKAMMHLRSLAEFSNGPSFASEITSLSNLPLARTASQNRYPIIASTEFVSKALVQAARYVGYGAVYQELFSLKNNRFEIYVPEGIPEGALFGDVAQGFTNSVLLGLTWVNSDGRRVAVLNPEPDFDLTEGDELIVLVRGTETPVYHPTESRVLSDGETISPGRKQLKKVLILGWNEHVADTVKQLKAHCVQGVAVTIASTQDPETILERYGLEAQIEESRLDLTVELLRESDTESVAKLKPCQYDVIIQMADQMNVAFDADAKSAINMFLLAEERTRNDLPFPPVIAEFLDEDNVRLCQGTPLSDAIITPQFLSMQLAHLSNEPILDSIFRELLSAGGVEIALRSIPEFTNRTTIEFSDLKILVSGCNEVALGYREGGVGGNLVINPSPGQKIEVKDNIDVVVLAQQIYG